MTDDTQHATGEHRAANRRAVLTFLGGLGAGGIGGAAFALADDAGRALSNESGNGVDTDGGIAASVECETPTPRAGGDPSTTEASDPTHVKLAANTELADRAGAFQQALYDAGLDESITVEPLGGSRTTVKRQSKYRQLLEAGEPDPAMLLMDSGWTMPFITRGHTQNLDELASGETVPGVRAEYFDASVMTATSPDGALHAQPVFVDFPTVQYRKSLFEAAGYGEGDFRAWRTDPPTWQTFAGAVASAREETGTEHGLSFQAKAYVGLACCTFVEFMSGWGGAYFGDPSQYLFGPVGDRPITVDEEPVLDAIRMVRSFVHGPDADHALSGYPQISPTEVLKWSEEPSREPFTQGKVVAHRNWPYSIRINADPENVGSDLGVMPIPYAVPSERARYPMTGGPTAALGGWHVTINPHASEATQRNAFAVMRAMRQPAFQRWAFETLDWLAPRPGLFDDSAFRGVEPMGQYLDTLRVAGENAVPRPVTRRWPQESQQIYTLVHAALAGERSPGAAMQELKTNLRKLEASER